MTDENNVPVAGISVSWGSITGGGSLTGATQITGANGVATLERWTLGMTPGPNTVLGSSAGLSPITFSAIASGPLAQMSIASGNNQTCLSDSVVPATVSVVVRDVNQNPVPGSSITWSNVTGGGSITGAAQITGPNGIASLGGWTLGKKAGMNTVTATAPDGFAVTLWPLALPLILPCAEF